MSTARPWPEAARAFASSFTPTTPAPRFKDTVRGGPGIAGLGAGAYYELSRPVSLVLEANGLAGFPTFSFVTDINLAVQLTSTRAGGR